MKSSCFTPYSSSTAIPCFLLFLLFFIPSNSYAFTAQRWLGQTVYVPVYSHIYADSRYRDTPFHLTAIVSIRNTDLKKPLTIEKVDYYDSNGNLLSNYLEKEITIAPLASTRYIVPESHTLGGSGAKFIISWISKEGITEPIIEGIMIGTKMQQGISFVTKSQVLSGTMVP
jgi:hypothetical protein